MTQEHEQLAEQLIETLKQNQGVYNYRVFKPLWEPDSGMTRITVIRALRELGFIEDVNDTMIRLTTKGWAFIGFEQQRQKELLEKQKEDEKHTLEVNQLRSVIETNNSVQRTNDFILDNSRRQNKLTVSSIIVAAASALFAFGAMYATLKDTTAEELKSLRQQLQKQSQVQEQMQQSQKGVDSSMKVFLQRSDTAHH